MSSYVFPYTLPGIQFDYVRRYLWNTGYQQALSGKVSTVAFRAFPLVQFEYSFEFLRDGESEFTTGAPDITAIVGLFNAVHGRWDTFLHTDPDFNTIDPGAQATKFGTFGYGTGSQLAFQLTATYQNSGGPGQPELIQNLNGTPILYANGTAIPSSEYSIGSTGIVTFGSGYAPASGVTLTWSGSWYYRCRFDEDKYDWKKMMYGLWSAEKLSFTSVTL